MIVGITVMRGLAAILVVMQHAIIIVPGAREWPPIGHAGVDIFFVISGFVMAYSTQDAALSKSISDRLHYAGVFLRKRIVRVVPLYWIALLWTARSAILQMNIDTGLVLDFAFLPRWNDRLPDLLLPVLWQGWTLNYEMFFYIVFAVCLLFSRLRLTILFAALGSLTALGILLDIFGAPPGRDAVGIARSFYTNPILLEFCFGVVLHRVIQKFGMPEWPRTYFFIVAGVAFAVLVIATCAELPRTIAAGLPAAIIIWASIHAFATLRVAALERIGDWSYAIYLFHWTAFGILTPAIVWSGIDTSETSLWTTLPVVSLYVVTAIYVGAAVHNLIEKRVVAAAKLALGLNRTEGPRALRPA